MTENLDWDSGDSGNCFSYPANDNYAKDNKLGKIYYPNKLLYPNPGYSGIQPGWRLPSPANWRNLIDVFGSDPYAYNALIDGGGSGLNLQLGGYYTYFDDQPAGVRDEGEIGYYATADSTGNSNQTNAIFDNQYGIKESSVSNLAEYISFVSVRFVKDIME